MLKFATDLKIIIIITLFYDTRFNMQTGLGAGFVGCHENIHVQVIQMILQMCVKRKTKTSAEPQNRRNIVCHCCSVHDFKFIIK